MLSGFDSPQGFGAVGTGSRGQARDGEFAFWRKPSVCRKPDGDYAWVDIRLTFERDAAGDVTHLLGKIVDVTDKVQAEERLKIFVKVIEQTADFVKITDRDGRLVFVNQALLDKTGYTEDELLGKTPGMLKSEMQDQAKAKALWDKILSGQVYQNRIMNRCKDGSTYHEDTTISPIFNADGDIEYFVSTGKDVSEQVKMQQALNEMAMKDVLTGLCNRRHLTGVIETEMRQRMQSGQTFSLILFDVDHFKQINDDYGHDVGDEILIEIARLAKRLSPDIDLSAVGVAKSFYCWGWIGIAVGIGIGGSVAGRSGLFRFSDRWTGDRECRRDLVPGGGYRSGFIQAGRSGAVSSQA